MFDSQITTAGERLSFEDCIRVCRDLAWCEIAEIPGVRAQLGTRISNAAPDVRVDAQMQQRVAEVTDRRSIHTSLLRWDSGPVALDSLALVSLATAAATWCDAFELGQEDLFIAKRSVAQWAEVMQQVVLMGAGRLIFSTSGSTGIRKHVRHPLNVLWAEARAWLAVLSEAAPVRRVIVLCPTHHLYGFIWGVLLPQVLGVAAVDADLASMPILERGDLIVAVPDQWAWLAESSRFWPVDVQGVSSTAPLLPATHRSLLTHTAARLSRLLQIYGSTETAGIAYRSDPDAPYRLAPCCSRSVNGGVNRTLPDGSNILLDVQDTLAWTDDMTPDAGTTFHIQQRKDLSVQVGGHNVSPSWVAVQLCRHPDVHEASVRLSTQVIPPRLKAFVVLKPPASTAQRAAIEQWAAEHLPWYALFSSITYGYELPVNSIGKPSDWPELT